MPSDNLGDRRLPPLRPSHFPDAGARLAALAPASRPPGAGEVLLVYPPTPDGGIWIRSRVDYVDAEMLALMGRAGCTLISWGIESPNKSVLKRAHKGYRKEQAPAACSYCHCAEAPAR